MMIYNVKNWFWIVGDAVDQVYSSAAAGFVAVDDAAYASWLAAGHVPTRIDSAENLRDVLAQHYPAARMAVGGAGASGGCRARQNGRDHRALRQTWRNSSSSMEKLSRRVAGDHLLVPIPPAALHAAATYPEGT